ncbi:MAG: DUF134 domain-containing protein [Desulfovibrio sp.]|nr:DUF134 domain-containing protein [Desulfovibrio sp.]
MARPRQCRYVAQPPSATYFKPCGIPLAVLDEVRLTVEGLEALRLSDIEGLNATLAAEQLKISRHTYGRLLSEARKAVAEVLVFGRALRIEGGNYAIVHAKRCCGAKRRQCVMSVICAVSSEGPSLEDMVDSRYGRAGGFIIATFKNGDLSRDPEISYLDNGDAQIMATGAGIATTEHLADAGVTTVMSGFVGPKAFEALQAAGITVIQDMDAMTVGEALARFREGKCVPATASNREAGNPFEKG